MDHIIASNSLSPRMEGGRGYSEFFYTYVGSGYFLGAQNFEFHFLGVFRKNEYFWGYEDFVDILGVTTKWAYI